MRRGGRGVERQAWHREDRPQWDREKGELTGSVAAAIFSATDRGGSAANSGGNETVFQGVEDWALYEEGLRLYLKALEKEPDLLRKIKGFKKELQRQKGSVYSEKLLELDRSLADFHANRGSLIDILKKLDEIQTPEKGSELTLLLDEIEERGRNVASIESEVKKLANEVKAALESKRLDPVSFNQKAQEFRTSQITPETFALFLQEFAAKENLSLQFSDDLARLVKNQKRLRDIEGTQLFRNLENYIQRVKHSLFRNEEEKQLDKQGGELELLERLVRLELSYENWASLNSRLKEKDNKCTPQVINDLKYHFGFYRNAEKRDKALFDNLISSMRERKSNSSLLVAGGFHTEGITERLRQKGISYLLLMPTMKSVPENSHYREHMAGKVSWMNYFQVENGKVDLYKAFVRATRDRLLGIRTSSFAHRTSQAKAFYEVRSTNDDRRFLLKRWRDQIIKDLAQKEQITRAQEYVPFLDEVSGGSAGNYGGAYRAKWQADVEHFLQNLRTLEANKQLTEQNLFKLFTLSSAEGLKPPTEALAGSPATMAEMVKLKALQPGDVPASLIPAIGGKIELSDYASRSEALRRDLSDLAQGKRDEGAGLSPGRSPALKSEAREEKSGSSDFSSFDVQASKEIHPWRTTGRKKLLQPGAHHTSDFSSFSEDLGGQTAQPTKKVIPNITPEHESRITDEPRSEMRSFEVTAARRDDTKGEKTLEIDIRWGVASVPVMHLTAGSVKALADALNNPIYASDLVGRFPVIKAIVEPREKKRLKVLYAGNQEETLNIFDDPPQSIQKKLEKILNTRVPLDQIPIDRLGVTYKPALKAFGGMGVKTLGDLVSKYAAELREARRMAWHGVSIVSERLRPYGLSLRERFSWEQSEPDLHQELQRFAQQISEVIKSKDVSKILLYISSANRKAGILYGSSFLEEAVWIPDTLGKRLRQAAISLIVVEPSAFQLFQEDFEPKLAEVILSAIFKQEHPDQSTQKGPLEIFRDQSWQGTIFRIRSRSEVRASRLEDLPIMEGAEIQAELDQRSVKWIRENEKSTFLKSFGVHKDQKDISMKVLGNFVVLLREKHFAIYRIDQAPSKPNFDRWENKAPSFKPEDHVLTYLGGVFHNYPGDPLGFDLVNQNNRTRVLFGIYDFNRRTRLVTLFPSADEKWQLLVVTNLLEDDAAPFKFRIDKNLYDSVRFRRFKPAPFLSSGSSGSDEDALYTANDFIIVPGSAKVDEAVQAITADISGIGIKSYSLIDGLLRSEIRSKSAKQDEEKITSARSEVRAGRESGIGDRGSLKTEVTKPDTRIPSPEVSRSEVRATGLEDPAELQQLGDRIVRFFRAEVPELRSEVRRIVEIGPNRLVPPVEAAVAKYEGQDLIQAQQGWKAITASLNQTVRIHLKLTNAQLRDAGEAGRQRLARHIAGAVRSSKFVKIYMEVPEDEEGRMAVLLQLQRAGKHDPMKFRPALNGFLIGQDINGFELGRIDTGHRTVAMVPLAEESIPNEDIPKVDAGRDANGSPLHIEHLTETFVAALLLAADPLSRQTNEVIRRSEIRNVYRVQPSGFGFLARIGFLLTSTQATASAA